MNHPDIPDSPSGYHLEEAVLTTFDLDMDTLQNLIGPDREAEKFIVFRGDGLFSDSSGSQTVADSLVDQIVKAAWPVSEQGFPEAFFHAKVWLFEYQNISRDRLWHLIIHSSNIHPYNNLETGLVFTGTDTGEAQFATEPLRALFQNLLQFITDDIPKAEEKRERLDNLICRLETVCFQPYIPSSFSPVQQAALSCKRIFFNGPFCNGNTFFDEPYDEMLAVSPVITSERLLTLADKAASGGRCVVLTNPETAGKVLSESIPNVCWLVFSPQDPFVHAKLFLRRQGEKWDLFCGSMNLTEYAMDRNIEFMVHLESPAVNSIESFLAAFAGRDEAGISAELAQYDTEAITHYDIESEVFSEAACIQTRMDYISHLMQRHKYSDEELKYVISYLLSVKCAEELARILHDPELPSVPLRKTVTVSGKKRETYSLPREEMLLLGLLNHALHRYDGHFSRNVFLHIKGRKPTDVFVRIRKNPEFKHLFLFRTDIHDFDPSMEADIIATNVHRLFAFDTHFCDFVDRIIYRKAYRSEPEGRVLTDGPAQPTGLPLGGFFENIYLQDFDELIEQQAAFYARCGDDILIGAGTMGEIQALRDLTEHAMAEKHLTLSEKKTLVLKPGEPFVFLGWKVSGGNIDFSEEALERIQKAVRKKTRQILIRYNQSGIPSVLRIPSLIRLVNRSITASEISFGFHIVTVPDGLRQIDHMICDAIRVVATGKTGKGRYRLSYKTIREWGYHSLVSKYYHWLSKNTR